MKNILETSFVGDIAPPPKYMRMAEFLPNFNFVLEGQKTDDFLSLGLLDFREAVDYVWRLPYGRNSNRADYSLVLKEKRGTCSTKHALLAQVAAEQKQPVFLTLGIYEMNEANIAGVGRVFGEYNLKNLPEAHCYLTFAGRRIDVTRFSSDGAKPIKSFLYEERIQPDQIGDYKIRLHRTFFENWMREQKLDARFRFEELWKAREKCVAALAQEEVD